MAALAGIAMVLALSACAPPGPGRPGAGAPGGTAGEAPGGGPAASGRSPAAGPGREDAALRAFRARGYAAATQVPVDSLRSDWQPPDAPPGSAVPLRWLLPQRPGPLPVVLYLPGLGESAEAGARWRQAWAQAGYLVLSVQALDEDAQAWRSPLARSGDFRALGQQHFGVPAMQQRVGRLAQLVAQARTRAAAGLAPWVQGDWQRVAVAGWELGAYTAMALAGERLRGASLVQPTLQPQAVLALSPHASLQAGDLGARWREVRVPVLSVTSDSDRDPLGLVENPALRRAPFDALPAGGSLLLSLDGLSHRQLAGAMVEPVESGGRADRGGAADDASASRRGRSGGSGGGMGGPGGGMGGPGGGMGGPGGGMGGGMGGRGSAGSAGSAGDGGGGAGGPAGGGSNVAGSGGTPALVAAADVSTAFLDAHLLRDPLALGWLGDGAPRWLAPVGLLQRK